jgi:polyhydroxyalkanoate synthesis regulator phasin
MVEQDHFPDLEKWPEPPAPMGHNNPPLEMSAVSEFETAIAVKGLAARVDEIVDAASRAPDITDEESAGAVGDLLAQAKAATKAVQAEREIINRPLLDAQRGLKGRADALLAPMDKATEDLKPKLDAWVADHAEVVHGDMGARVGHREAWDFQVTDYAKLPLAIRRHPTVIEAIDKVVRGMVRSGERKIAGVTIWSNQKATVR